MSRDPGRLALVAALLLSAAPAKVDADQIDVRGNWQVNINCDLNATASIFLLLDEDADPDASRLNDVDRERCDPWYRWPGKRRPSACGSPRSVCRRCGRSGRIRAVP